MMEIPLFPLDLVLFPGMPLQLHIFEERYKRMVEDSRAGDSQFGVVLIREGVEANGPLAVPYSIGCIAQITSVETLSEGRYNLWTIGQDRFQIMELRYDRPYLVGLVEKYPLRISELVTVQNNIQTLRPWIERYLRSISQNEDIEQILKDMPEDPFLFAYLGAVVLQIPPVQKQPFLETRECLSLLKKLEKVYHREVALVESLQANRAPEPQGSFSLN